MTFKASRSPHRWKALGVTVALLLFIITLIWSALALPISGFSFILGVLGLLLVPVWGYIALRTWGCFTLEYWVERDGVTIIWGPLCEVVPMVNIERIVRGARSVAPPPWWQWPDPYVGIQWVSKLGRVTAFATAPPEDQLLLVTRNGCYGISPADSQAFLHALQERYQLGPARMLQSGRRFPAVWTWPVWRDRLSVALLCLGVLGLLWLLGYASFVYPSLPPDLRIQFDAAGQPLRIAPKSAIFILPVIGLLAWAVNGIWGGLLYRAGQALAAYLLWGGAVVVQVAAWFALRSPDITWSRQTSTCPVWWPA